MPYRTVSSEKTGRTSYAALEMGSPKPYNTLCRKMKSHNHRLSRWLEEAL